MVVRAIQHDRNKGNREAGPTESKTCACGGCQVARPGATTVYELPSEFRNCSPTGEQFAANDRGMSLGSRRASTLSFDQSVVKEVAMCEHPLGREN